MFCHQCNSDNLESSKRCIQCGANLIGTSVSSPEDFANMTRADDSKVYGRTWATVFTLVYFLAVGMFMPEIREERWVFLAGGVIALVLGRMFGRSVARIHNGDY